MQSLHSPPSDFISNQKISTYLCLQVAGSGPFDVTRAYNLAVKHSRGSRILKLDADNIIAKNFVAMHPFYEKVFYSGNWQAARSENERHLNGVFLVNRVDWATVNGFDERIVGYGYDDDDLNLRLQKSVSNFYITRPKMSVMHELSLFSL